MTDLTQEYLQKVLHYNPENGVFTWKSSTSNRVRVGGVAGGLNHNGYVMLRVNHKRYMAHRLAWLYINGAWPTDQIDHINGIRSDNRISNLRQATRTETCRNSSTPRTNTSGVKGVSWASHARKWRSQCEVGGKCHHLGYFTDIAEAERVVRAFREERHGKFANHGN